MPSGGGRDASDGERLFERAMEGVERLGGKGTERLPRRRRSLRGGGSGAAPVRFEIERWGEHQEGRAAGVDRRQLRRLRQGKIPVELRIDLHGLDETEARAAVRGALTRALGAGLRCLAVIHGRGLRSAGGPVLKEALPVWLAEPPHGRRVLAFTTAPPAQGGPGATLVWLRKSKRGKRARE
jgi:DNA-nicking Smr family endonuclease